MAKWPSAVTRLIVLGSCVSFGDIPHQSRVILFVTLNLFTETKYCWKTLKLNAVNLKLWNVCLFTQVVMKKGLTVPVMWCYFCFKYDLDSNTVLRTPCSTQPGFKPTTSRSQITFHGPDMLALTTEPSGTFKIQGLSCSGKFASICFFNFCCCVYDSCDTWKQNQCQYW